MRSFLKSVLANIVAMLIMGSVFFAIIATILLFSAVPGDQGKTMKEKFVLTINLRDDIIVEDTKGPEGLLFSKGVHLYNVLSSIRKAKTDDRVKGISVETDVLGLGHTQMLSIRAALEDFKTSGKFVLSYGGVVSQQAFVLGSVADRYYLNPVGGIELKGLFSEILFLKDFSKKYGINVNVVRHGKFKSAVEPFLRNDISPESRAQLSELLNDIWSDQATSVQKSRKISHQEFQRVADSLYGMIPDLALKYGLADALLQKSEYDEVIKKEMKIGKEEKLEKVSLSAYVAASSKKDSDLSKKEKIAVLYACGEIFQGKASGKGIYSENFIEQIKKAAKDERIKAVVLRVNSPGGSASASDEILFELQETKKKKPVVVSFGDYAASGGYYISMAADRIFSEPSTITGSIGVFGIMADAKELLERNGVHTSTVQTNVNSRMHSPLSGASAGTLSMMHRHVEAIYKRFVHVVSLNRKKSFEEVDKIGEGRVWSGRRAKEIGLVDELGSLNDAVAYAASTVGLQDYEVISLPKPESKYKRLMESISNMEENVSAYFLKKKLGEKNYNLFKKLSTAKLSNGIEMILPYQIEVK